MQIPKSQMCTLIAIDLKVHLEIKINRDVPEMLLKNVDHR